MGDVGRDVYRATPTASRDSERLARRGELAPAEDPVEELGRPRHGPLLRAVGPAAEPAASARPYPPGGLARPARPAPNRRSRSSFGVGLLIPSARGECGTPGGRKLAGG